MQTNNVKFLITAGCSFSQVPNKDVSWPVPLQKAIGAHAVHLGQGAAGNGIISRKVIYHTLQALETYKPEEILVGIMWSAFDRKEIFAEDKNSIDSYKFHSGEEYSNPVPVAGRRNFHIMNSAWTKDNEFTKNYFMHAYNEHDALMSTIEHILRIQWFLKLNNIPYFMTQFHNSCLGSTHRNTADEVNIEPYISNKYLLNRNKDLLFLFNQINFSRWLPIDNCYEWCKHDSGKEFTRPPDPHPSTEQHEEFVKRVILPFLVEKNLLYDTIV